MLLLYSEAIAIAGLPIRRKSRRGGEAHLADNAFININKKVLNNVQNNAPTSNINKPDQTKISFKLRKESAAKKSC